MMCPCANLAQLLLNTLMQILCIVCVMICCAGMLLQNDLGTAVMRALDAFQSNCLKLLDEDASSLKLHTAFMMSMAS